MFQHFFSSEALVHCTELLKFIKKTFTESFPVILNFFIMFDTFPYLFNNVSKVSLLVCYKEERLVWDVSQMSSLIQMLLLKGPRLIPHLPLVLLGLIKGLLLNQQVVWLMGLLVGPLITLLTNPSGLQALLCKPEGSVLQLPKEINIGRIPQSVERVLWGAVAKGVVHSFVTNYFTRLTLGHVKYTLLSFWTSDMLSL